MAARKRRNEQRQVAALPLRLGPSGVAETLLVTSRRTRRWVIPKGNPMKGKPNARAASIEAEEEAGIVGEIQKSPYGRYDYWKRRVFSFQLCRVEVFLLPVAQESAEWKEMNERERAWVPLRLASRMVLEPGLQSIFRTLAEDKGVVRELAMRSAPGVEAERVHAA